MRFQKKIDLNPTTGSKVMLIIRFGKIALRQGYLLTWAREGTDSVHRF